MNPTVKTGVIFETETGEKHTGDLKYDAEQGWRITGVPCDRSGEPFVESRDVPGDIAVRIEGTLRNDETRCRDLYVEITRCSSTFLAFVTQWHPDHVAFFELLRRDV